MSQHIGLYTVHSRPLRCTHCGNTGSLDWEDVRGDEGARPELVSIAGNFHERLANAPPYRIELICDGCGHVQDGL